MTAWEDLEMPRIVKTRRRFLPYVEAVVGADGGYIE